MIIYVSDVKSTLELFTWHELSILSGRYIIIVLVISKFGRVVVWSFWYQKIVGFASTNTVCRYAQNNLSSNLQYCFLTSYDLFEDATARFCFFSKLLFHWRNERACTKTKFITDCLSLSLSRGLSVSHRCDQCGDIIQDFYVLAGSLEWNFVVFVRVSEYHC